MKYSLLALVAALIPVLAHANDDNALPSCYAQAGVVPAAMATSAQLFVIVDQTTVFDAPLRQSIANGLRAFLKPGNQISIYQFSAYSQGKYTQRLLGLKLEPLLPSTARDDVGKPALAKLDACLQSQNRLAGQLAGKALRAALDGGSNELGKSDILSALRDISAAIRQSSAQRKVVLMASDMLENSTITSFYSHNTVRKIDPKQELQHVTENRMFADFSGANIYVVGAGLLPSAQRMSQAYRDPKTMNALSGFWQSYFQQSHAKLIELGQPALLKSVE